MINDSKTEFLIIGSRAQLSKININSITVGDSLIEPVKNARNLGSWFEEHMAMDIHDNVKQITKFLSTEATNSRICDIKSGLLLQFSSF